MRHMSGASGEGSSGPRRTILEVQFHPSDIRRGVRTYFLDRNRLAVLVAIASAFVVLVLVSVGLAPRTVRSLLLRDSYVEEMDRRVRTGERLAELTERMSRLERRTVALRERLSRVYLTYGLEERDLVGQGAIPSRSGRCRSRSTARRSGGRG